MAQKLSGANDVERLLALGNMTYKEQSVWFLNAFWPQFGGEAERVWNFAHRFIELDVDKKDQGNALDELNAHRFLEKIGETLTVHAMRDRLRSTGAIGQNDRPKLVPIIHYLLFKYGVDFHTLVNAPQGNKEEIDKAQRLLDEVQAAFREATAREAEAKRSEEQAKARERDAKASEAEAKAREADAKASEADARAREADARAREDELRAAQEELEAALAELKAQEDAFNNRTEELKRLSTTGGLVSQNKAKNELAQHLSSDPLPLRRAKITQEAAVKKAEKATAIAAEARAVAENARVAAENARKAAEKARQEAERARQAAERAREAAEEAVEEARRKVEEAEAYLEEVKARVPEGAIWWMERELHEARAYLPASKGGYKKQK